MNDLLKNGTYRTSEAKEWAMKTLMLFLTSASLKLEYEFRKEPETYFYGVTEYAADSNIIRSY